MATELFSRRRVIHRGFGERSLRARLASVNNSGIAISPKLQRWVPGPLISVRPGGTAERGEPFQASLRDAGDVLAFPNAEALGVSKSTFYRLVKAGWFTPAPQLKRNRLFLREQLVHFVEQAKAIVPQASKGAAGLERQP